MSIHRHNPTRDANELYHLRIDLPGAPRMNTADNRHWRVRQKEKKAWHEAVRVAEQQQRVRHDLPKRPLLRKARVCCTRCSSRQPDFENLAQGFKFIIDALCDPAGVLFDDCPAVIGQPEYKWEKAKRGEAHVVVEVWQSESTGEGE